MSDPNPDLDAYFAKPGQWQAEKQALRAILLDTPLSEERKWWQPCYTYGDGNIVMIGGYKKYCTLSFMRGALLDDPEGLLVAPGENSQAVRMLTFTRLEEVAEREALARAFIDAAIELKISGRRVDFKQKHALVLPEELQAAFAEDADFKAAFEALTPGRQRSHVLHISGAKQSATRETRVERCRSPIFEGKGFNER